MKKNLILTRYVNLDTGEYKERKRIVDNVYQDKDFVMNYRKKKFTIEQDGLFPDRVPYNFKGMFYSLMPYLNDKNMLQLSNKPFLRKDFDKVLGASNHTIVNFLKCMKEYFAIRRISFNGKKWYVVNPVMANKGKRVSYIAFKVFEDYMTEHGITVPVDLSKLEKEFKVI